MKGFLLYADARIANELEDKAYKAYITDAAKVITGNTARFAGGSEMTTRYWDIVNSEVKPKDNRTAEELLDDVIKKTGIVVVEE